MFYKKKSKIVQGFADTRSPRHCPGSPGEDLKLPPRPPASIVFGFAKNRCAHIFSVLYPANGPFWSQKWHILITGTVPRIFFNFAEWKEPIGMWKFYSLFFEKRIHLGQFYLFSPFYCLIGHGQIELGHC